MNDDIARLKGQGKTQAQIAAELGIAKSTVAYQCSDGLRQAASERAKERRQTNRADVLLEHRLDHFKSKAAKPKRERQSRTPEKAVYDKVRDFQRRCGSKLDTVKRTFTVADVRAKFGEEPKCYLSGRPVKLDDPDSYRLDHIIPASKGGDNSLENLALTCPEANTAKADLPLEEFLALCETILSHHGRYPRVAAKM